MRCLCIFLPGPGLSLQELGYQPWIHHYHSVMHPVEQTREFPGSERCPRQREVAGHSCCGLGKLRGSSSDKISDFSHSHLPSWSQFRSETSFEILIMKILPVWGVIRARRKSLRGCLLKSRCSAESTSAWEETVFLISSRGA